MAKTICFSSFLVLVLAILGSALCHASLVVVKEALPAAESAVSNVSAGVSGNLTNHAKEKDEMYKNLGKQWSVTAIVDYMAVNCHPRHFVCREHEMFLCPIENGRMIGLIQSFEGKIVTAFDSSQEYWLNQVDRYNCYELLH